MSFQQGLSGLGVTSKSLEVIGNNVANAGTFGFKGSRAEFADMYAAALNGSGTQPIGIGATIATVAQQFTQGNITVTENPLDIAISGSGFFQVGDGQSPPYFTRNGQFKVVEGTGPYRGQQLVADNNGLFLIGIPDGQTVPGPLVLPTGRIAAQATTGTSMAVNLDSGDPVLGGTAPATVDDLQRGGTSKTVNFTTSQQVFDALGESVSLTYYFRREPQIDGRDAWAVYLTANEQAVNGTNNAVQPAFYMTFDAANGGRPDFRMTAGGAPQDLPDPIDIPAVAVADDDYADTQAIAGVRLDLTAATQFAARSEVTRLTQDGYSSGQLKEFTFDSGGILVARYTNGQSRPAGQVLLAGFINPQGLQPLGGNLWAQTVQSGQPTANAPGEGSTGVLQQGALEESNVDLTAELVNMITAQRTYQANAQTIKTMDQVLQTLVNLR
ncbi:MAG: flagellar hook protein FlgE [Rubrivivax sp.]|jgi:flagellar hook protein FlgE|nr:flagellar hook protein FlgE [Rubrivivax sp.]